MTEQVRTVKDANDYLAALEQERISQSNQAGLVMGNQEGPLEDTGQAASAPSAAAEEEDQGEEESASLQTIRDGSYSPLARPFYYYFDVKQLVRNRHAKVPSTAVATFLQVALSNEAAFAAHNFVIPLTAVEITNERISWLKAVRAYERQKQLSASSAN